MPAVSMRGGGRRRTISEINMVPFIDVMLVLLIIFMVTAPLITTGVINVPSVGTSGQRSEEHTSELQSLRHLVCRLLLEKKETEIAAEWTRQDMAQLITLLSATGWG